MLRSWFGNFLVPVFHRTEEEGGAAIALAMCLQLMEFYLCQLCRRYSRQHKQGSRLKSLKTEFTNRVHQLMQPCRYDMIRMVTSDLIILPAAPCSFSNTTQSCYLLYKHDLNDNVKLVN